jgi:flavin-dependent dehydrogenase
VDPISGSGLVRALRTAQHAAATALALLAGEANRPVAAYEAARDQECTQYLRERALYYGAEGRWAGATFWQRRTAA